MPLSALLPIGGAALGMLASRAFSGIANELSFKDFLGQGEIEGSANPESVIAPRSEINLQEAVTGFGTELREKLAASGVDLSQKLTLKSGLHGAIEVDGDHPQRAAIEDLLNRDDQLASAFQQISAAATETRRRTAVGTENRFGEFRLECTSGEAMIRFE